MAVRLIRNETNILILNRGLKIVIRLLSSKKFCSQFKYSKKLEYCIFLAIFCLLADKKSQKNYKIVVKCKIL